MDMRFSRALDERMKPTPPTDALVEFFVHDDVTRWYPPMV